MTKFFEQFERGEKSEEYRLYGSRWNERTCAIGRRVVLSLGYSGRRLSGVIEGFRRDASICYTQAWLDCYGETGNGQVAACIAIRLDP